MHETFGVMVWFHVHQSFHSRISSDLLGIYGWKPKILYQLPLTLGLLGRFPDRDGALSRKAKLLFLIIIKIRIH